MPTYEEHKTGGTTDHDPEFLNPANQRLIDCLDIFHKSIHNFVEEQGAGAFHVSFVSAFGAKDVRIIHGVVGEQAFAEIALDCFRRLGVSAKAAFLACLLAYLKEANK